MNRHFEDTRYYLKRAGTTAKQGIATELEPVRERVDDLRGKEEEEVEQSRIESIRADLGDIQTRAEGEAKEAISEARERLGSIRGAPEQ
jgi:predicted  nucleic acid-binding Zn-ribbon protein